jgi:hypothetical protein
MKKLRDLATVVGLAVALSGCVTTTTFRLPPDTQVRLDSREVSFPAGPVRTSPYFWNSSGGIRFTVEKEGKLVEEGKLAAQFRPASIFWPPPLFTGLIYWPVGFAQRCYDLNQAPPYPCGQE